MHNLILFPTWPLQRHSKLKSQNQNVLLKKLFQEFFLKNLKTFLILQFPFFLLSSSIPKQKSNGLGSGSSIAEWFANFQTQQPRVRFPSFPKKFHGKTLLILLMLIDALLWRKWKNGLKIVIKSIWCFQVYASGKLVIQIMSRAGRLNWGCCGLESKRQLSFFHFSI